MKLNYIVTACIYKTIYCTLELVENERKRRQKGKLRMDNPETLATMNTQDTSRRQINRQKYPYTSIHLYFYTYLCIEDVLELNIKLEEEGSTVTSTRMHYL
jgi:hypothetical protein